MKPAVGFLDPFASTKVRDTVGGVIALRPLLVLRLLLYRDFGDTLLMEWTNNALVMDGQNI